MTVKDFVKLLLTMPEDLEIIDMGERVTGCHVNHEYYDGDPANPNCKVIEVVEID